MRPQAVEAVRQKWPPASDMPESVDGTPDDLSTARPAPPSRWQMPTSAALMSRLLILVPIGILLPAAPLFIGAGQLRLLVELFTFMALAQIWNLLAGYAGLISIGQQAFVGLGGYVFFALAIFTGIHPLIAIPLAGIAAAIVAVPTAWLAFRLNGAYFAVGTWVIAEIFRLGAAQISALGGGSGISLPVAVVKAVAADRGSREQLMYWLALALVITTTIGAWLLLRSRWGLALTAIRDSETAAESVGVPTRRTKFLIYILTAGMTGLTGAFVFLQKLRITPEAAFSVTEWTAFVIFIVVIGGVGAIEGPIVGAILFFALREIAADWGSWYPITLGGVAIAVMLMDKRGIWGALRAHGMPDLFWTRRSL